MGGFLSGVGSLARWMIQRLVRIYYPMIEVTNPERIPPPGPVLFVANHANSLIDPVIIGITAKRPVHFLAKAPLFDMLVLGPVMRALGMVPAFRGVDDPSLVKRNLDSLAAAAVYLVKGEAVGLFPEGKSHDLPKVEQVRSGAARIAVKAVQDGACELRIVPLGLNFETKERFRSPLWVRVGEPIHAGEWIAQHGEDERRAMRSLTTEIDRRLKEVVVHLNEESWEPLLHDLEVLHPAPPERARLPVAALRQRKRIADAINHFLATDRPRADSVAAAIQAHRECLAAAGLNIQAIILRLRGVPILLRLLWDLVCLLIGAIPAFCGLLHHLIPFLVVRLLTPRLQAPGRATIALTRLCLSAPIYAVWYAAVWLWMARYFSPGIAWVWLLAMPFAGIFAVNYVRRFRAAAGLWISEVRMLLLRSRLEEFRRTQLALRQRLNELADEYAKVRPPEPSPPVTHSQPAL
jgi:glycerol-3-phosphate O-acyltransferase/dihydroxyacetone phosphate acyltransferase